MFKTHTGDNQCLQKQINMPQAQHLMVISPETFQQAIQEAVSAALNENKKPEVYISVKEAMKRLDVSRSTLWHWDNSGYLNKIKRGKKVTYRLSDVERIINGEILDAS